MAYWNGNTWASEPDAAAPDTRTPSLSRRIKPAGLLAALVLVLAASSVLAAPTAKYTKTLTATPNVLHAGDYFDVSGCGYDPSLGNVIVSFTGGGWGSSLNAYGCFTITGIPALSGDSLAPGTYEVRALQFVKNRWRETGQTSVTIVQ